MKYITIKQQFTFPEPAVKGFAIFLGWKEKIIERVSTPDEEGNMWTDDVEIDNPQTFVEYVEEKAIDHTLKFTKSWAEKLKQDYLDQQLEEYKDQIEPTAYAQIIKPVEDALTSEVIIN